MLKTTLMTFTTFAMLCACVLTIPCQAQEQPPQVEDVQIAAPPAVASRMIIASGDSDSGMGEMTFFSTGDDMGVGNVFLSDGMSGMPAPDIFSLAQNSGVQKEIELVDDQMQQIRDINRDFSKKIQSQIKELTSGGGMSPERGMELSKLIKELNAEKKSRMEGVLLPHQFDRLRQIALQTHMKRSGESAMLASANVIEELGLSEEQQEKIKERAKELKEKMEAEIKRLKEESREALYDELTREQRDKLKGMMGEDFEMPKPDFGKRFKRRGSEKSKDE